MRIFFCFLLFLAHLRQRWAIALSQCPLFIMRCLVIDRKRLLLMSSLKPLCLGLWYLLWSKCPVDLYQVCSVGDPRVQNDPAVGGLGFENEICLKIFSRTARLRCLKFGMIWLVLVILYQVCSNSGPRSKMVLPQGVLGLNHRNT